VDIGDLPAHPDFFFTLEEALQHKKTYLERIDHLTEQLRLMEADGEFNVKGWARGRDGGLTCVDYAQLESQKGVMTHLIKSFGANLIQGKSVVNVSLPVRIFEPRSFLQRIPDAWCYAPIFLTKAAFAELPLQRFLHVITFMVAGLHKAVTNTKPFNPILGETFQGCFKDGSQIFLEQTSHHPPISSFQLIGPNNIYHVHGSHEFAASLRPNSIQGSQIGPTHVDFLDGTCITFNLPYALVCGTVIGDRNFTWMGTCRFVDELNGLSCDLIFNPDEKNGFARMFSSQKTPDDHIRGEVYYTGPLDLDQVSFPRGKDAPVVNAVNEPVADAMRKKKEKETQKRRKDSKKPTDEHKEPLSQDRRFLGTVDGSWMDGWAFYPIDGDQVPMWSKGTIAPFKTLLHEDPLPSDCRFREDLVYLIQGNMEEAQKYKSLLEERQREEKNLRKMHEKTVRRRMDSIFKRSTSASNIRK